MRLSLSRALFSMSMSTRGFSSLPPPKIGYGLYQIPYGETKEATLKALSMGYRHLDSASFYANEDQVGEAIAASGIDRKELYVATKVWTDCIGKGPVAVEASVRKSLELLNLDYVDCCYVHWPCEGYIECYHTLEKLCDQGLVRAIGLSNFRIEDYEKLLQANIRILPIVNQLEVNPWMYRKDTIEYFQQQNMHIVAYKPLLRGKAATDPKVLELSNTLQLSPGQLLIRWLLDKSIIVIPRSQNEERMHQNLHSPDLKPLDSETTHFLDSIMAPDDLANFDEHFSRRAVVDANGPTLALYSGSN